MNSRKPLSSSLAPMVRDLRRVLFAPLLAAAFVVGLCQPGLAQHEALELGPEEAAPAVPSGGATLFLNVRIFDGRNAALSAPSSVLVRSNVIERISPNPAATEAGADVRV